MAYRYIALFGNDRDRTDRTVRETRAALADMGMVERLATGSMTVFASPATPTLPLPFGGILIGHLFMRDGSPITSADLLPEIASIAELFRYLVENCWGEYLLLHCAAEGNDQITAIRDPAPSAGLPCLYAFNDSAGFFTSQVSIAQHLQLCDARIDWGFIARILEYPHTKNGQTGLVGVHELLPGCAISICGGRATFRLVWSPWDFVEQKRRHNDPNEAVAEFRKAVTIVVKTWADLDGSLLLELSGGLDSSIVGASLLGVDAEVICCTLAPPVPGADERQYAGLIADVLGVELQAEQLPFESALFDFETPYQPAVPRIGPLQYAVNEVMEAAGERNNVSSHFSGGGGDTTLCYPKTAAPAADAFIERGVEAGIAAIRDLAELHQCTFWKAAALTVKKLRRASNSLYKANRSFLPADTSSHIYDGHPWTDAPAGSLPGDRERIFELAGSQIFRDSVPRGGRPFRMPLLAQPVVEACLKTPTWMWIKGGQNRAIARSAFADRLPTEILNRRSKGTFMNYLGAVYRRNRLQMRDYLLSGHLHARGLLDGDALRRFTERSLSPRDRSFTRIFELCMIENWVRHQR